MEVTITIHCAIAEDAIISKGICDGSFLKGPKTPFYVLEMLKLAQNTILEHKKGV